MAEGAFFEEKEEDHGALWDMSAQTDGASAQSAQSFFYRSLILIERGGASLASLAALRHHLF